MCVCVCVCVCILWHTQNYTDTYGVTRETMTGLVWFLFKIIRSSFTGYLMSKPSL